MNYKNSFDNDLKSCVSIKNYHFKATDNIFEKAWSNRKDEVPSKFHFILKPLEKPVIAYSTIIIVVFITFLTIIPSGKAFAKDAYNSIKMIFTVEKNGDDYKIVEKPENTIIEKGGIGSVDITDSNKAILEKRLGFSFSFPVKLGNIFTLSGKPFAGLVVYDIPYNELKTLEKKFYKAIEDEKIFKELNKYNIERPVGASYLDKDYSKYYIYIGRNRRDAGLTIIKEFLIEDVKCKIVEGTNVTYPMKNDGTWCSDDSTQEPTDISKLHYVTWDYNGINYKITTLYRDFNLNYGDPIKFAEEYIKMLKQQK